MSGKRDFLKTLMARPDRGEPGRSLASQLANQRALDAESAQLDPIWPTNGIRRAQLGTDRRKRSFN